MGDPGNKAISGVHQLFTHWCDTNMPDEPPEYNCQWPTMSNLFVNPNQSQVSKLLIFSLTLTFGYPHLPSPLPTARILCNGWYPLQWLVSFAMARILCNGWYPLQWLVSFAMAGILCNGWYPLQWLVSFAMAGILCNGWYPLQWLVSFAMAGILCNGWYPLQWLVSFAMARILCNGSYPLQWLVSFAMARILCNGSYPLQWLVSFAMAGILCNGSYPLQLSRTQTPPTSRGFGDFQLISWTALKVHVVAILTMALRCGTPHSGTSHSEMSRMYKLRRG